MSTRRSGGVARSYRSNKSSIVLGLRSDDLSDAEAAALRDRAARRRAALESRHSQLRSEAMSGVLSHAQIERDVRAGNPSRFDSVTIGSNNDATAPPEAPAGRAGVPPLVLGGSDVATAGARTRSTRMKSARGTSSDIFRGSTARSRPPPEPPVSDRSALGRPRGPSLDRPAPSTARLSEYSAATYASERPLRPASLEQKKKNLMAAVYRVASGRLASRNVLNRPRGEIRNSLAKTAGRRSLSHAMMGMSRAQRQRHMERLVLMEAFRGAADALAEEASRGPRTGGFRTGALGETTGAQALAGLRDRMRAHPVGAAVLRDRPTVDTASLDLDALRSLPLGTFGHAYVTWMDRHGYSPDARPPVRYVADGELAYIMQRYRQTHDFTHVLLGLPPTVLGEVVIKWFELAQTQFPMTFLSAVFGPAALPSRDMRTLWTTGALAWASRAGRDAELLLNVRFEDHLERPLEDVRGDCGLPRQGPPSHLLEFLSAEED